MARGLLSNPVTPRQIARNQYLQKQGVQSQGGNKRQRQRPGKGPLPMGQNAQALLDQQQQGDLNLGGAALGLQDRINQSYAEPFDWNSLPSAPVTGDYNAWVKEQQANYNKAFDERTDPVFQAQQKDFDQSMIERGIPMGSELYNSQLKQLRQDQNDARTQAYAAGQGQAIQGAESLFNVGTSARGNAYADAMNRRGMPLQEYNQLMGSRSGLASDYLDQSQARDLQSQQFGQQKWLNNNQHSGGGGGGGGGAGPTWAQYGFSNPQEYDAYKLDQARQAQMWDWKNNPQYRTPKQPNPYASLAGNLLGAAAGGWASGGFKPFW